MSLQDAFRSAVDSLNAVYKTVQALAGFKERAQLIELITSAQGKLLEVQALHESVARRVGELETEVVRLTRWNDDKRRYRLHELAPGALVYRLDPAYQETEPTHDLCPHCYQDAIKSILQAAGHAGAERLLVCHRCKASVQYRHPDDDFSVQYAPRRREGWEGL